MAIGALRVPVHIAESYVRPGDEQRLFSSFPEYLSLDEIRAVWPRGFITHETFSHKGHFWRLMKRPMANGKSVYVAVPDAEVTANGNGAAAAAAAASGAAASNGTLPARCSTPDTAQHLRSMPIDGFSPQHDGSSSDLSGVDYDVVHGPNNHHRGGLLAAHHSFRHHHPAAAPAAAFSVSQGSLQLQHNNGDGFALQPSSSLREQRKGGSASYSSMALVASQPSGGQVPMVSGSFTLLPNSNGFMADLLSATESPMPLDRFKAFVRLFSTLGRMREAMDLPPATPHAAAEDVACWDSPNAHDLVRQVLMVGECLAKFGTADFVEARNNSSRAITTKDYAKLLRMYLEGQGAVFRDDFICRLPLSLQDEALTVRTLLQTRCETNDLLFNQLVKHVGQEPAAGGAVVFNNSSVTANPTNHMLAAPRTFVNTVSNAWSKADAKRRTQLGAVGAVAVVALWVLKRKLFGGGRGCSGRRGRRGGPEDSEWDGGSGRHSSRGGTRGNGDIASRLLDERSSAERMAVRFLSACHDELQRAQHNDQLLRNDWRLGPIRLSMPGSGNVPPGYEPVQTSYCSLASYVNALDGSTPFVLPYGFGERSPPPRDRGLSSSTTMTTAPAALPASAGLAAATAE